MDNMQSFWQLGDQLRGQARASEDTEWFRAASRLAEQTRSKGERLCNLDLQKGQAEIRPKAFQEENKFDSLNFNMLNLDSKLFDVDSKLSFRNGLYNMNAPVYQKGNGQIMGNITGNKYAGNNHHANETNSNSNEIANTNNTVHKRFKTLPAAETLPRDEVLGGYIFVCNNDTMQEDLKRRLFGLPPRYRDSVRVIMPGLPLFLYNYTTHQLHGIFEAASFGGSNIDPTAWEDKKCKGESRFPAQVRIRIRKICKAMEEDSFQSPRPWTYWTYVNKLVFKGSFAGVSNCPKIATLCNGCSMYFPQSASSGSKSWPDPSVPGVIGVGVGQNKCNCMLSEALVK